MDTIHQTAVSRGAALPTAAETRSAPARRMSVRSTTFQVLVVVWLVLAGFVGFLVSGLLGARRSAELRVRDQAASYARLVEHHAAAAFARADVALLGIMDHLLPADLIGARSLDDGRRKALESLLREHQRRTPGVIGMFLVDAGGGLFAHSRGIRTLADVSDRDYFRSLQEQRRGAAVVSEAVYGRITGQWGVQVVRRVDLPDGRFGGLVGATLGLTENFTDFYATLTLGRNSTVSLRDVRSRLLVRFPVLEGRLGKEVGIGGLKEHLLAGKPAGVIAATSDLDRAERIFGFRKLSDFPIYAVVGLSIDDALSAWRLERDMTLAGTLLFLLAGVFITTVLLQKQRANDLLRSASLYTRSLIETSLDPLVTVDASGKITDINQAAERATGCSRAEMIGTDFPGYFTEPGSAREGYQQAFSQGFVTDYPLAIRHRDGHVTDVLFNASVYRNQAGEVLGVCAAARDMTKRKLAELELGRLNRLLEEQAIHDPLTGLFNRRYLDEALERELSEADRGQYPVSFIMIDIDRFKVFNDRFGHQTGDQLLRAVGGELRETTRGGDIACRYGGEEFLLVLPQTPAETAVRRAEQWRSSIEALAVPHGSSRLTVTISAGVAVYPVDGETADAVISAADRALYAAKGAGRNRVSRLC